MDLLANFAAALNGLDGVVWSDLRGILQANYRSRIRGETLEVKMYSRRITIPVPAGITRLRVHRPWIENGDVETITVLADERMRITRTAGTAIEQFALEGAGLVEIRTEKTRSVHFSYVKPPATRLWPAARKVMMEARDRLRSVFDRGERLPT
jgi:hypothetical protein